jgi:hypothetical protein
MIEVDQEGFQKKGPPPKLCLRTRIYLWNQLHSQVGKNMGWGSNKFKGGGI